MKDMEREPFIRGVAAAMAEGGVYLPAPLLRGYRRLGLTDSELVLLIQLAVYRQAENNGFPTPEQLGEVMGIGGKAVGQMLQKLLKEKLLTIDELFDPVSGVQSEVYNWHGWIVKTAEWMVASAGRGTQVPSAELSASGFGEPARKPSAQDVFSVFEQEFGRPLSPMELETIGGWLDTDRYPEELIRFALKEAVFAGKLHFRYIDRILLEWSRNRVTNVDEARAHAGRFRNGGKS